MLEAALLIAVTKSAWGVRAEISSSSHAQQRLRLERPHKAVVHAQAMGG